MKKFDEKVFTFTEMLSNAYRDKGAQEPPVRRLTITDGTSFTEDLTAILCATFVLFKKLCQEASESMDLIDFTHLLNKLAVQYCFDDDPFDADSCVDEEQEDE